MARQRGEGTGEHVCEEDGFDEVSDGEVRVKLACCEEAGGEEEPEGASAVGAEAAVFQDFEPAFGGVSSEECVCGICDGVFVERAC